MPTTRVCIRIKACTNRSRHARTHRRTRVTAGSRRDSAIALSPDGREDDALDRVTQLLEGLLLEANTALQNRDQVRTSWPHPQLLVKSTKDTFPRARVPKIDRHSRNHDAPLWSQSTSKDVTVDPFYPNQVSSNTPPYRYPRPPAIDIAMVPAKAPVAVSFQRLNASMAAVETLSRDLVMMQHPKPVFHLHVLILALLLIPCRQSLPAVAVTTTNLSQLRCLIFLADCIIWLCLVASIYNSIWTSQQPVLKDFHKPTTRCRRLKMCAHDIECQKACKHKRPIRQLFYQRRYTF